MILVIWNLLKLTKPVASCGTTTSITQHIELKWLVSHVPALQPYIHTKKCQGWVLIRSKKNRRTILTLMSKKWYRHANTDTTNVKKTHRMMMNDKAFFLGITRWRLTSLQCIRSRPSVSDVGSEHQHYWSSVQSGPSLKPWVSIRTLSLDRLISFSWKVKCVIMCYIFRPSNC